MPDSRQPKQKSHDAVFKAFFSDAKIAKNYLLHYTPEAIHQHIDFAFFQKIDTAFVSGRFGISAQKLFKYPYFWDAFLPE